MGDALSPATPHAQRARPRRARSSHRYPRAQSSGNASLPLLLAALLARDSRTIEDCDEMLTLTGLRIIYDREQRRGPR